MELKAAKLFARERINRGKKPILFIEREGDNVIGAVAGDVMKDWGGSFFAFDVVVDHNRQGRGIGKALIKATDDYYESIDMPTALHPQTLLTFSYDGERLPAKYGFPMKLRMPTKLGYKNPKHIVEMFVTNTYPGGYWVDQGYNWFGGS